MRKMKAWTIRTAIGSLVFVNAAFATSSIASSLHLRPSTAFPQTTQSTRQSRPVSKSALLGALRALQGRQVQEIEQLEESIKKSLEESKKLELGADSLKMTSQHIQAIAGQLEKLTQRRNELLARRDLVDRLIFAVDTKWQDQPVKVFFENEVLNLALAEMSSASSPSRLWKFLTYLSIAIREIPEPQEDILAFIEGYMNFSGVLEPVSPTTFLDSRNYTNGAVSTSAQPVPRDKVGAHVDKRLEELGLLLTPSPSLTPPLNVSQAPTEPVSETEQMADHKDHKRSKKDNPHPPTKKAETQPAPPLPIKSSPTTKALEIGLKTSS